ncbi:MAG: nicotinate (nicotinamide) nucleotide adenylyltransferase [Deltaproteobacteria bacterium]|nr:nicotinate (nicotinamide) nucleotide adenylyltransferase [Deltaproteobacteria bacterium]
MQKTNLKMGLFGGTFDPVHIGHIKGALQLKKKFALDKIMFIPAAIPPHKQTAQISNAKKRLDMLRLAVKDYPYFEISDIEIKKDGISYSIDTINYFISEYQKASLFFITGYDAFIELHTWKSYKKLLNIIQFIVMARPNPSCSDSDAMKSDIDNYLKKTIDSEYKFSQSKNTYLHSQKKRVFFADILPTDISSANIRLAVKKGKDITNAVTKKTADYIKKNRLYL